MGQEGEVPWGRCSGGTTPLAGGHLTDSQQHSRAAALKRACSRCSSLSSTGFLPFQSLGNAFCVYTIYVHRGKGGKGCEGGPNLAHFPVHHPLLCVLGPVASHLGASFFLCEMRSRCP